MLPCQRPEYLRWRERQRSHLICSRRQPTYIMWDYVSCVHVSLILTNPGGNLLCEPRGNYGRKNSSICLNQFTMMRREACHRRYWPSPHEVITPLPPRSWRSPADKFSSVPQSHVLATPHCCRTTAATQSTLQSMILPSACTRYVT